MVDILLYAQYNCIIFCENCQAKIKKKETFL